MIMAKTDRGVTHTMINTESAVVTAAPGRPGNGSAVRAINRVRG